MNELGEKKTSPTSRLHGNGENSVLRTKVLGTCVSIQGLNPAEMFSTRCLQLERAGFHVDFICKFQSF